ncbi:transport and Golgi organization protein 1 homolog isoform X2 [Drosophila montana]|uniref:transport and Golgi organization protein 1 homolog isoform X2 n=1 Tax=Drosophila montana TaxID=40370 RepID=UPI00313D6C51
MDMVHLGPENNSKFSYTHEPNPSTDSAALRPAQCHVDASWSTVGTQVLVTSESIVEQQSVSWSPSRDMDRIASMKIFTSVMLHAWRQRRADVRRLQQVVDRLQRKSMHSKNELHVSNTLMRVEQKRCKELQLELKKSTLSINEVRSSCEKLTSSVRSLKADKDQLEQELSFSRQEHLELERKVGKCKDDLLGALMEQRNLQLKLSEEQSNVHQLAREKEMLSINMRNMEAEFGRREESYIHELEQKNEVLYNMRLTVESLERRLRDRQRSISANVAN